MTTIPLDHASPHGSRDLPGCALTDELTACAIVHPYSVLLPAGGSYSTVSPSPASIVRKLRCFRQTILCGAIPKITLGGCYPPPYPRGARTFLDCTLSSIAAAAVRPTGESNIERQRTQRKRRLGASGCAR